MLVFKRVAVVLSRFKNGMPHIKITNECITIPGSILSLDANAEKLQGGVSQEREIRAFPSVRALAGPLREV